MALSWPVVQRARDLAASLLGESLHRCSFWDVLSNQTVRVLVRSAFPRSVRISEVDLHSGCCFDLFVAVKLRSVVDGDGAEQVSVLLDHGDDAAVDIDDPSSPQLANDRCAGDAFDQSHDAVAGLNSDNDIHLPVADLFSLVGRRWPFGNVRFSEETAAFLDRRVALSIADRLAEMLPQCSAALLSRFTCV